MRSKSYLMLCVVVLAGVALTILDVPQCCRDLRARCWAVLPLIHLSHCESLSAIDASLVPLTLTLRALE